MESIVALRGKDALGRLGRVFIAAVLVALVALCTFAPTVRRIGDTISPTLLSVFGNGVALPGITIAAPLVYFAKARSKARAA